MSKTQEERRHTDKWYRQAPWCGSVADNTATDSDHHTPPTHQMKIKSVGTGAYAIWWNGSEDPDTGCAPAGGGVCSFTGEAVAAEHALFKVHKRIQAE